MKNKTLNLIDSSKGETSTSLPKDWFRQSSENKVKGSKVTNVTQIFDIIDFKQSEYFKIEQIAEKLKVSTKFIYEQLYAKKLKGQKVGRVWRIEIKEIEKWLALQQEEVN